MAYIHLPNLYQIVDSFYDLNYWWL